MSLWHIVRHPETGGVGVIHEAALQIHKNLGWIRVGEVDEGEKDHVDKDAYEKAPDLDAEEATKPAPAEKPAAKSSKEN